MCARSVFEQILTFNVCVLIEVCVCHMKNVVAHLKTDSFTSVVTHNPLARSCSVQVALSSCYRCTEMAFNTQIKRVVVWYPAM